MEYEIGKLLETAVMMAVGKGLPMVQLILRTVLSATVNLGAAFVMSKVTGKTKSANPET